MGLDVYLKKCPDIAAADAAEAEYERRNDGLWSDSVTKEERDQKRALAAANLGTDAWGTHSSRVDVRGDSTIDAEHLFKVGYFRSSYNEGGINRILRNLDLLDLNGIMGAPDDGSNFAPDWEASLGRVNDVIAKYEQHLNGPMGKYGVTEVSPMYEFGVSDEKAALAKFQSEIELNPEGARDFSNRDGLYHLDGIKVCAVITKTYTRPRPGNIVDSILNTPSVFLVYEKESDGKQDWYLTALQIVRETIEYVIAQPDRQHFYMVWSG